MIRDWTKGCRRAAAAVGFFWVLCAGGVRSAGAQIYIWWEASPLTAGSQVVDQGLGKALQLSCDRSLQPGDGVFSWDVVMRIQNDVPMIAWSLDLRTAYDSVSASETAYGEQVLSPSGALQGYVPLGSVIDFVTPGAGIELMRYSAEYGLTPSATFESSDDGVAWNCFAFRLTRTLGETDPALIEIYGETGPFASSDDVGFFDAIVGDNGLEDVSAPGFRYAFPVITISAPPGALWSPNQPEPDLYPDDQAPPTGGGGTGNPGETPPGGGGGTTTPGDGGGPDGSGTTGGSGGDEGSVDGGENTSGVNPNGQFVFEPPRTPIVPVDEHPATTPDTPAPGPAPQTPRYDDVSVVPVACGVNGVVNMTLIAMGFAGFRARRRCRR